LRLEIKEGKESHLVEKSKEPVKVANTADLRAVIILDQKPLFDKGVVTGVVSPG